MSQEMSSTRRALSRVSTDLKQGKLISAAISVRDAARLFTRGVPMIKKEHEELVTMLHSGCELLRLNKELAKHFPLAISYTAGQEAALIDLMNQLIEALQEASTQDTIRKHEERKKAGLVKGRQELAEGDHDEARKTLRELTDEYGHDAQLATEVGECFLEVGLYLDAAEHLSVAARLTPDSAHVFNRLGIALRKMKRFDKAEQYFFHALELEPKDPNLYFNMGRLYLDTMDWKKTIEYAEKALDLSGGFTEAAKLAAYARKKLSEDN